MGEDEATPASDQKEPRKRRDWIAQLMVPVVVAVLGAVLVTALTPLGKSLRELIFPTQAVVTGTVTVDGQVAEGVSLTLDGRQSDTTSKDGTFLITDVRAGTHILNLEAFGAIALDKRFTVTPEESAIDLGAIDLKYRANLGYYVSLHPRSGQDKIDYDVTLWVDTDESTLSTIEAVTYVLPDPLSAKPVKGKKSADYFCYRRAGTLRVSDFFNPSGSFGAAQAEIEFPDGTIHLAGASSDIRPPMECPSKGSNGGESGGGQTGGGQTGGDKTGGDKTGGGQTDGDKTDGDKTDGDKTDGDKTDEGDATDLVAISCTFDTDGDTYQSGPNATPAVGQEVRWVNGSSEDMALDIGPDPSGWDVAATQNIPPGGSYTFTFSEAAAHDYTCVYDSHKVSGKVTVEAK